MLMFSEKLYLVDQSYGKDYYKVYDSFPLNFTSHNDIILSDPMTSYHLAGIYGFHVYGVLLEHMNQANEKIATDRYYKLSSLFITQNLTIQDLIKENPKENYVLVINKRYIGYGTLFPSNISFEYIKNMTNGYETIENDNFILKKLKIINSS